MRINFLSRTTTTTTNSLKRDSSLKFGALVIALVITLVFLINSYREQRKILLLNDFSNSERVNEEIKGATQEDLKNLETKDLLAAFEELKLEKRTIEKRIEEWSVIARDNKMNRALDKRTLANEQYKVQRIELLKQKKYKIDEKTSRDLLEEMCWKVQPIMKKREWTVPVVTEMPPKNTGAIGKNFNRGEKITIMVRKPERFGGSKKGDKFFDLEHCVLVMLHELSHITHMNHSKDFWKLLDELTEEYYALKKEGKGGTGEGFDAKSIGKIGTRGFGGIWDKKKAGENPADAARKAALKRQEQHNKMIHIGGVKLGGGTLRNNPNIDPREAARVAAENRMKQTAIFSKQFGLDLDDETIEIDMSSDDDDGDDDNVVAKKKKSNTKEIIVIDLLSDVSSSSSDDETVMQGGMKRKCLCCDGNSFCKKPFSL